MIDLKDYVPVQHDQCIINEKYIIRVEYLIVEDIKPSVQIVMIDKTLIFNFETSKEAKDFLTYVKSYI